MKTLLRDLRTYSRTIHAEPAIAQTFQTAEALADAKARLEIAIRESGADVEAGELPAIEGDRVALSQVFQNLLSNALKYRSGESPRIRVVWERCPEAANSRQRVPAGRAAGE